MRKIILLATTSFCCAIAVAQESSINFIGNEPESVEMDFIGKKDQVVSEEPRKFERSEKKDLTIDWFAHEEKGSAPPQGASGGNKLAIRRANRIFVIYHEINYNEKVCDPNGNWCRQEFRNAAPSISVIKAIKSLPKTWNASGDEQSHFVLLNYDKPEDRKTIQSLGIKLSQMPVAVRESDKSVQKSISGFDASKISELWNEWLDEDKQYQPSEAEQGMPSLGGKGLSRWHIKGGNGTIEEMRAHLCDPNSEHRLPKKAVDAMSDEEVWRYHDWDHAVMEGSITPTTTRQSKQTKDAKPASQPRASLQSKGINVSAKMGYREGSFHDQVANRIHGIVASEVRQMPMELRIVQGSSESAKKKRSKLRRNGLMTNGKEFVVA